MTKKSMKSTKEAGAKKTDDATKKASSVAVAPDEVADRPSMFDPFGRLHLSDWFDRWPEIFSRRWPESFEGVPFVESGFRMEQFRDDDALVVRGELPGLDPDEDVTITIADDVLTIAGERSERSKEERDGGYHSEFHYGSFRRSVRLPAGAKVDDVTADYRDGILEVRVPIDDDVTDVVNIPVKHTD